MGEYYNRVQTDTKVVALTFDDGPLAPFTSQVLATLRKHNVKATFFFEGNKIKKNSDLARLVHSEGHQIGNHAYYHVPLILKKPTTVKSQIEATDTLIRSLGVTYEIYFRAPYGKKLLLLPYILNKMHKKHILFDVEPCDWKEGMGTRTVVKHVVKNVKPGSIILLHDGNNTGGPNAAEAADLIIQELHARGYEFKTVAELLQCSNH